MAVLGLVVIVGTGAYLVREWPNLDKAALAMSVALPIWLTLASLPFIFLVSLYANYEMTFLRIDFASKDDVRARRRAKLALIVTFHFRNRELHRFVGLGTQELARSTTWSEARRVIALHRAEARLEEAKKDVSAKRLARYSGVEGTDWDGRPLDQREFEETKRALDELATYHRAQHSKGRYRDDLMTIVGGFLSKTFPGTEIVMTVAPRGRSWFAWRRTVGGVVPGHRCSRRATGRVDIRGPRATRRAATGRHQLESRRLLGWIGGEWMTPPGGSSTSCPRRDRSTRRRGSVTKPAMSSVS